MVLIKLKGGLGNQMFQYAFGKSLATARSTSLKLDLSDYNASNDRQFRLDQFNCAYDIAQPEEISELRYQKQGILRKFMGAIINLEPAYSETYYREPHFHFDQNPGSLPEKLYFEGYWQSERYFERVSDSLRDTFSLKNQLRAQVESRLASIKACESVSIHVRRGDYVSNPVTNTTHGTCDIDYYKSSVDHVRERTRSPRFFVFSDDLAWAREHLSFVPSAEYIELEGPVRDCEELFLMTQCRHNIIANSSFSWWGAWLNPNPQKIVIHPARWFADQTINTDDLIPEHWTAIQ